MADPFAPIQTPPLLPILEAANRAMYRTIKASAIAHPISCLAQQAPAITAANQRLASYLPPAIRHPYVDTPLYTVCLRDAARAAFADDKDGQGCLVAYFSTLLERASLVLRYDLVDHRGAWDPLYGDPLVLWLKEPQGSSAVSAPSGPPPNKISLTEFISGMCHRLVPEHAIPEIQHLRRGELRT